MVVCKEQKLQNAKKTNANTYSKDISGENSGTTVICSFIYPFDKTIDKRITTQNVDKTQ